MNAQMLKQQIICWLGGLTVLLSLNIASCEAQDLGWCPTLYWGSLVPLGRSIGPYPTDIAALQAGLDALQYGSDHKSTVVSCNGQGMCTVCFNWPAPCTINHKFWDGIAYYNYEGHTRRGGENFIVPCGCRVAFDPAVPYSWNPATGRCESPLTITLSGGTEVEPSKGSDIKTLPITATVKDQNNQPTTNPVEVKISLKVDPTSGGHDHGDSNRPRGGIEDVKTCASDNECWTNPTVNGVVEFNFSAPEAAGTHTITATCEGCSNTDAKPVDVKVDGLKPIPASAFLYTIQLPNRDTNHPDTSFLTKASIEKLRKVALYYYAYTYRLPKNGGIPDFVLNDASLEWGGVLDCFLTCNSAMYPSTPWHKHHIEHRRGSVVDVKANGSPGTIVYDKVFRRWAKKFGVQVGNLHGSGGGLHYHLRLNNGARE